MTGALPLLRRLGAVGRHVRIQPFETSTEEGRARERRRRALLTTLANLAAKSLGFAVMVLSLRVALPYLGQERYGILATIVSFSALLTFVDLGIGNALISHVAQTGVEGEAAVGAVVSRAVWVLAAVGSAIAVVLCCVAAVAPLGWAFKGASTASLDEARRTLLVFGVLFGASVPLGAVQKVYLGLQRGYVVHVVSAACALVGLALLYGLTRVGAAMPAFLFVGYGMQVVSGAVLLAGIARTLGRPRVAFFRGQETRKLLRAGGMFFMLQIGVIVGWGSDPLILSATLGPGAVVVFTVTDRLTQFISVPLAMLNGPLWASYADALAVGDRRFIRQTLRSSMLLTALAAIGIAVTLFATRAFWFALLSKDVVRVPSAFVALYLAWVIIRALGDCFAMYLNGVHVLRPQLVVVVLYVMTSLPAKLVLGARYGLAPFIASSIVAYLIAVGIPYATFFRAEVLRSLE